MSLFDVVEVEIATPHRIRVLGTDKTEGDAAAIVEMAVMRRGVDSHFYVAIIAGKYRDGDCLEQSA